MAIPEYIQKNFDTLCRARDERALCLMECRDAITGDVRYVLAAAGSDGDDILFTPFGHMSAGNPYEEYVPPTP